MPEPASQKPPSALQLPLGWHTHALAAEAVILQSYASDVPVDEHDTENPLLAACTQEPTPHWLGANAKHWPPSYRPASHVGPSEALRILEFFNPSAVIAGRGRNMAAGDFSPSFELAMARKDVGLMMETAGGQPLAALPSIAQRMDELIAQGHGDKDLTVIGKDAVSGHVASH